MLSDTIFKDKFKDKSPREIATIISDLQQKLLDNEEVISANKITITEKSQRIEQLQHQLHTALHARFSPTSEKIAANDLQASLFDEAIEPDDVKVLEDEEAVITVAPFERKKPGRKPLPKDLPRVRHVYDLPEEEKTCACGCALTKIGESISEQLDYIPAKINVIQHVRLKYACRACEETIKVAQKPTLPLPKSIATPNLLGHVLTSKYCDHLPLYRLESILRRYQVDIPRNTLCNWVIQCGILFKPLVALMKQDINRYDVAYSDETVLQVLKENGRPASRKSYMWVFTGGSANKRCYIYQYSPTRGSDVPLQFFDDFSGHLHVDCYAGYNPLTVARPGAISLVACWAHARRYFVDVVKNNPNKKTGLAHQAVAQIAKLYAIEKQAKEEDLSSEGLQLRRAELSKPLLDEFKTWLDENILRAPPKSPIGRAMAYSLTHWDKLLRYLDDGRLEIDNNRSERAIKPFVIGRKNWMFSDSVKGAEAGATIYSLIETCKAHAIEPYAYLKYVLGEIRHCKTDEELANLLPYHCDPKQLSKSWLPRQEG